MGIRIAHYFGMWVVILFTMVHAYLAAIDGFKPLNQAYGHLGGDDPREGPLEEAVERAEAGQLARRGSGLASSLLEFDEKPPRCET